MFCHSVTLARGSKPASAIRRSPITSASLSWRREKGSSTPYWAPSPSAPIICSPAGPCMPETEESTERPSWVAVWVERSEEHTSELQSRPHLVCRLLLEKKKKQKTTLSSRICCAYRHGLLS